MSYPLVHVMSGWELNAVRSDQQGTRIYGIMIPQQTIFSCQCSGSVADNDNITSIGITNTSGSFAKVVYGMTGYIGSSAGASDLGVIRVKSATATTITCGGVSGIPWNTNVYITVVDDFGIWSKVPSLEVNAATLGTTLIASLDDNVAYTDQNTNMYPIPIMGPDRAIPYTAGSTILDGTNSYCPDGTAISSWSWGITNGSATSGSLITSGSYTSSGSTFTAGSGISVWKFSGPGSYIVSLTVTSTNGKSTTGHRNAYIYDSANYAPSPNITLDNVTFDRDAGGVSAHIKSWSGIDISTVHDRSKVILIADDYASGSSVSMGQVSGCEKTLFVGWMSTEVDEYNRDVSTGEFDIHGPYYWLQQVVNKSSYLFNVTTVSDWFSFNNLTFDKFLYHMLYWRSTAMEVMDCYPSYDTRITGGLSMSIDSIWGQIKATAEPRFGIDLVCDRYGRFMPFVNPQLQKDHTTIPVVMSMTKDDFGDTVKLKRTIVAPVGIVEAAGLAGGINDTPANMYLSRAPGRQTYSRFGNMDTNDNYVINDQAQINQIAGALYAWKNNVYNSVGLALAGNNKLLDIAPAMYVTITVTAADNIRGLVLTNLKMLIRRMIYRVDEKGKVTIDFDGEGETIGSDGYSIIIPDEVPNNVPNTNPPVTPNIIPIHPLTPVSPYGPTPLPPTSGSGCIAQDLATGPFHLFFDKNTLDVGQSSYAWCHCKIRKATSSNPTTLHIYTGTDSFSANMKLWAVDANGGILASAGFTPGPYLSQYQIASFSLPGDTEVWGFKLTLQAIPTSGSTIWIDETGTLLHAGVGPLVNESDMTFVPNQTWFDSANETLMGWCLLMDDINGVTTHGDINKVYSTSEDIGGGHYIAKNGYGPGRFTQSWFIADSNKFPGGASNANVITAKNLMVSYYSTYNYQATFGTYNVTGSNHIYDVVLHDDGNGTVTYWNNLYVPVWFGTVPTPTYITINGDQLLFNVCPPSG